MAAPAIPPIRLGLTGTGLAVEKPHRPASRRRRPTARSTHHRTSSAPERNRPEATTHSTVFRGIDNGYRAESVDLADAGLFDGLSGERISSSASFAA